MRSRPPLLASRASRPRAALLWHDAENNRVHAGTDARDLHEMLSSKGAGSPRSWRNEAIVVLYVSV